MKKCALFLFLVISLFSCKKEQEIINYIEINGQSYQLRHAFFEDYGTTMWGVDVPYREYYIELQSHETDFPSSMLGFYLYSWDTRNIGDGTYRFGGNSGDFQQAFAGVRMQYDSKGQLVDGLLLENLDPAYNNRIDIRSGKRNKIFDINLRFIKGGQSYTVTAHYENTMVEHIPVGY
ncbi:MAG: hypothetical protein FWC39_07675 [Bacteroidetes bacterium]|nr:hypothetical protein [Bacteroidota bacterium]